MQKLLRSKNLFLILFILIFSSSRGQNIIATYGSVTRSIEDFFGYNGTNTVRIFGWENPQLPPATNSLSPGMLRYPGGAYANWWDWRTGWFKTQNDMPAGMVLPGKYILDYSFDNHLEQFKKSIDATGAAPIYVLNMLTASLEDQIAMLYHAQCFNLPVKYIELGKEFYDDDPSVLIKYPTPESYAADILLWTNELLKHFPDAKIAFVSAYEYNNDSSPYSRRKTWNERVTAQLALYGASYPVASSAGTMYMFQSTGNPGVNAAISTPSQVNNVMESGYKILDHLQTTEVPHLTLTPEIWVTEVNMMDQGIGVHGTWAHGLFSVLADMRFLEELKVKHALIHNLIGDAIYSALFDDTLGFCFSEGTDGAGFIPPLPTGANCNQYPTTAMQKTATGNALAQLGTAMLKSNEARKISFTNAPFIPGTSYKTIYGWKFTNTAIANSEQLIILNLDSTLQTLDISSLSLGGNLSFQQITSSPYTPVQGNMSVSTAAIPGSTFTLPPYSITRVYKSGISSLNAFSSADTICSGNATSLHARGADTYSWSPAAGLSSTTGPDVEANPSITTTYTVTDNYSNTKQVTITVVTAPTVTVSGLPAGKICQGQTLNLTASGGLTFNWEPKPLTSNTNGSSVSIAPQNSTTYTVSSNDGSCYCGEFTFTMDVAGEVILGNDHLICAGASDTLATGSASYTYLWTSSDGSLNSTLPHPVVSPVDTTIYYMQSSELSCTYYDTIVVNTMNCCGGGVAVTNSSVDNLQNAVAAVCAGCVQNGNTVTISDYSGDIFINGILTVEKTLKFINCPNVKFNHAGKINILQNYDLTLDSGSVLKDCNNEMWQGVVVYDAGSLVRVQNGSTIENAETGIDCSIDSKLYLENANMINNYNSVKLHDYLKAFIGNIFGTNFICSSNTALITPHAGERTHYHFLVRDIASASIGDASEAPNSFSYFDYGVKADSVEFTIVNSNFSNFQNNGVGLDILGTNESLNLIIAGGTGTNEKLTFNNGSLGIHASGVAALNIQGNSFDNMGKAVFADHCYDPLLGNSIDISQNTVTNSGYGIACYYNSNSDITINQNNITLNADSASIGISAEDQSSTTQSNVTISNNIIFNTGSSGVYMNQIPHGATVSENVIHIAVPQSSNISSGIKALDSDSLNVIHNSVFSMDTINYNGTQGVFIQNSAQSYTTDNAIYFTEKGITCNGSGMYPSRLRCNLISSSKKGIVLENNCIIGIQGDSAANYPWNNQWVPSGYYDVGNPGGNVSVYADNSDGTLSKFFTRSAFPYLILTSGFAGSGVAVPFSILTGTGPLCLPPLTDTNENYLADSDLFIYPNPASQELYIIFKPSADAGADIYFYNVTGKKIFATSAEANVSRVKINLNNLSAGIYVCEVLINYNTFYRQKFVIIRD